MPGCSSLHAKCLCTRYWPQVSLSFIHWNASNALSHRKQCFYEWDWNIKTCCMKHFESSESRKASFWKLLTGYLPYLVGALWLHTAIKVVQLYNIATVLYFLQLPHIWRPFCAAPSWPEPQPTTGRCEELHSHRPQLPSVALQHRAR